MFCHLSRNLSRVGQNAKKLTYDGDFTGNFGHRHPQSIFVEGPGSNGPELHEVLRSHAEHFVSQPQHL